MATSFFDYPDGSAELGDPDQATFLPDASDEDWAVIRAHAEVRHYTPGQTVVDAGEVDRSLFIVVAGTLEVTVPDGRRGRSRHVASWEPGAVIGEVSFFDARPRSAAVRAMTDVKVLRLTYESFEALAAKEPALGRAILFDIGRVLALRLRDVEGLL